jgi:hypothetical protein
MVMTTAIWRILKLTAAWLPGDARVTVKGLQLLIDALRSKIRKAKNYTPQQLMDFSFLP